MKSGAEIQLRRLAFILAGDIAEDECRLAAEAEGRSLRAGELTAYHEAGHGDLGRCFGFAVAELRLLDHPHVTGICLAHPWDGSIDLDELVPDSIQANQIFVSLHVCGYRVSIPRLKRVIRRLLRKRWIQITLVAERLLSEEKKYVDAKEISEALAAPVAARCQREGNYYGAAEPLAAAAAHGEEIRRAATATRGAPRLDAEPVGEGEGS